MLAAKTLPNTNGSTSPASQGNTLLSLLYSHGCRDELILHKQYDSDTTKKARYAFHTSCTDPTAPSGIPTRTSIEVRRQQNSP